MANTVSINLDLLPPAISFNPTPGVYSAPLTVHITSNEVASVWYTLDGSTPAKGAGNTLMANAPFDIVLPDAAQYVIRYLSEDDVGNQDIIKVVSFNLSQMIKITSVRPNHGHSHGGTTVTVVGDGFSDETIIYIGDEALHTHFGNSKTLNAKTVFMSPGVYDVSVHDPVMGIAVLHNAFTVSEAEEWQDVIPELRPGENSINIFDTNAGFFGIRQEYVEDFDIDTDVELATINLAVNVQLENLGLNPNSMTGQT